MVAQRPSRLHASGAVRGHHRVGPCGAKCAHYSFRDGGPLGLGSKLGAGGATAPNLAWRIEIAVRRFLRAGRAQRAPEAGGQLTGVLSAHQQEDVGGVLTAFEPVAVPRQRAGRVARRSWSACRSAAAAGPATLTPCSRWSSGSRAVTVMRAQSTSAAETVDAARSICSCGAGAAERPAPVSCWDGTSTSTGKSKRAVPERSCCGAPGLLQPPVSG